MTENEIPVEEQEKNADPTQDAEGEVASVEPENLEQDAVGTIRKYVYSAMAVGLIPAPVVDLAGLTALQIKMVHSLAKHYDVPFMEDLGKSAITSLVGAVGPITLARGTFGSLVKAIPVIGTAVGIATQPVLSGAFTYAVGKVFIQHFEAGGTFLDLDPKKVKAHFAQQFQEGKLVAKEIAAKKSAKTKV
jgi:uncharacterized protein (DUF697 family)